jgi:diketogulonate reductase-like aldo/keto reductase
MGINFIDTPAEYGRSEELVGKACAGAAPTPIICTKIALFDKSPAAVSEENLFQHLAHHLEKSRQRLQLDTPDLVKLHSLSTPFVTDELTDALASFVERGWVRYWGVTTYGLEAPLDALRYPEHFRSLQVAYSALDRTLEDTLFPAVHQGGQRPGNSLYLSPWRPNRPLQRNPELPQLTNRSCSTTARTRRQRRDWPCRTGLSFCSISSGGSHSTFWHDLRR